MDSQDENLIVEKLDEIKALLKIMALQNFKELLHSILSTKNKHKIYELCNGENEMGEIAKLANVSGEAVRLTIRDFEDAGIVLTKKRGKKAYPKRVL